MEVYWNKGTLIKGPCTTYKIRVQQAKISKIRVLFFAKSGHFTSIFKKVQGRPPLLPPPPHPPHPLTSCAPGIQQRYNAKMDTTFMNSKNSITSAPHRLLLNVIDKINYKKIIYKQYLNYLMDHVLNQLFQIILNIY